MKHCVHVVSPEGEGLMHIRGLEKQLRWIDVGYTHLYIKLYIKALISASNENSWVRLMFLWKSVLQSDKYSSYPVKILVLGWVCPDVRLKKILIWGPKVPAEISLFLMADHFAQGLVCDYDFRLHSTRKAFTDWNESMDRPPRWSGAGARDIGKGGPGLHSLEKRWLREILLLSATA